MTTKSENIHSTPQTEDPEYLGQREKLKGKKALINWRR